MTVFFDLYCFKMTNGEHCCSPFVIDYQSDTANDLINAPLVFVLVEEKILFRGIVRPKVKN